MKGQGGKAIPPSKGRPDILTSTLAAFLFSSHPKRERNREAQHLQQGKTTITMQNKIKSNMTKTNSIIAVYCAL